MTFSISQDEVNSTASHGADDILPGNYKFVVQGCTYGQNQFGQEGFMFTAVLKDNLKEIKFAMIPIYKKDGSPNIVTKNTVVGWVKKLGLSGWDSKKPASVFNGQEAVAKFDYNSKGYLSFKWLTFDPAETVKYGKSAATNPSEDVPF